MSDNTQTEAQAIVEQVKTAVDERVATKAEAADLAAVKSAVEAIEVPSVEGFVKSEVVAELREALTAEKSAREALEATFKAAPAITKGAVEMHKGFKWDNTEGYNAKADVDLRDFLKAVNSTTDTINAPVSAAMTYWQAIQTNPLRGVATSMPVSTATLFLPSINGITAAHEASIPSSIDTSSGHGGALGAENQLILQNWTSRTAFSEASVSDLPDLDSMVAANMGNRIASAEAIDMVSQINAATVTEVNTGQAAALPDVIDPWAELVSSLSSAYKPNARFVMSREALESLRTLSQGGTGSPLVIDPSTGNFRLWNYEIIINDHFDAGDTAGDNPVYFGDFSMGMIIATKKEMTISRHEDTIPGAVYYYGNMRSRGTVWNPAAIRRFTVAA